MQVEWIEQEPHQVFGRLGQLSERDVLGIQAQMNIDNRCIGSPIADVAEDGLAGSKTCAMAEFLNTKTGTAWDGSICPGGGPVGSYPASELCAMASRPPPEPPGPPPGEEEEPPPPITGAADKKETSPWLWAAAGVAVVALGAMWLS